MSRKTRKRVEGLKDLGVTVARKNPVVDNVLTTKEVYDSTYKIVKGENPPSPLPRSLRRRLEKELMPPGVAAAERGK